MICVGSTKAAAPDVRKGAISNLPTLKAVGVKSVWPSSSIRTDTDTGEGLSAAACTLIENPKLIPVINNDIVSRKTSGLRIVLLIIVVIFLFLLILIMLVKGAGGRLTRKKCNFICAFLFCLATPADEKAIKKLWQKCHSPYLLLLNIITSQIARWSNYYLMQVFWLAHLH
jgi:hypothetical protein